MRVNVKSNVMWLLVLAPLIQLLYGVYQLQIAGNIFYWGAEPGKVIVHLIGQWALVFLGLVLLSRHIKAWPIMNIMKYRRRIGLAAFLYGALHMLAYLGFLLGFEFSELVADIEKRPYILMGFIALVLLVPLAVTSTKGWQKRLKQKWKPLHLLVYPASILVLIHLWWQVKAGFMLAIVATVILLTLFVLRFFPQSLALRKTSSNL